MLTQHHTYIHTYSHAYACYTNLRTQSIFAFFICPEALIANKFYTLFKKIKFCLLPLIAGDNLLLPPRMAVFLSLRIFYMPVCLPLSYSLQFKFVIVIDICCYCAFNMPHYRHCKAINFARNCVVRQPLKSILFDE